MVDRQPTPGVHENFADAVEPPAPVQHLNVVEQIAAAMQDDPFTDDIRQQGTSQQRLRAMHYAGIAAAILGPSPQSNLETDDTDKCPICANPFKPDDVCATDIEMGTCHAACLEGSPVVDLDTGDELPDGKVETYPYSEVMDPAPVQQVEQDMKFHPDVLAAHAQFGGDLESMQKCYEWMPQEALVRLVELAASYCHGSAEYWNDKDANVLIEMARRMAPCTEAAGANLYKLRAENAPSPQSNVLESDPVTLRGYCQQLLDMIENYGVDIEGEDNDLIAHISRNVDPAYVEPAALAAEGRDNG
jgi:hypothetical protein